MVKQQWSNGTHGYLSYTKLATADGASGETLRFILLEDSSNLAAHYRIKNGIVESTLNIGGREAIQRSHILTDETFTLQEQSINLNAAVLSVTMPDG